MFGEGWEGVALNWGGWTSWAWGSDFGLKVLGIKVHAGPQVLSSGWWLAVLSRSSLLVNAPKEGQSTIFFACP